MTVDKKNVILDITAIKKIIPHRYPFIFVDKVIDFKQGEYIEAIKNVTNTEHFFEGHFPTMPIMPGVLIVEALAQTSALYYVLNEGKRESDRLVFFMAIDECKFRKPVVPGDVLSLRVKPMLSRGKISRVKGEAYVDDKLVCEAVLTAMINDTASKTAE